MIDSKKATGKRKKFKKNPIDSKRKQIDNI